MDKAKQFWDKQSGRYDNSERQFDPVFEKILKLSKNYLKPTDSVMDFGCATGTKTFQLAESVKHIHGIDLSSGMIKIAKEKASDLKTENIKFSSGTVFENDFQKEQFDVIISYGVLHLLTDIDNVLLKINDLLKPGGLFISSSACMKDKMAFKNRFQFLFFMFIKAIGLFPLHLNFFKFEDIVRIISENNFKIIEKERIFGGITAGYIVAQKK